jgi:putative ABC transport system substrate-binding protein
MMKPTSLIISLTLALSLLAAPLAAGAQQVGKVYRIGCLDPWAPGSLELKAVREGLRDLGYVEGQNIAVEPRWAEGQYERLPELASELVRLQLEQLAEHAAESTHG